MKRRVLVFSVAGAMGLLSFGAALAQTPAAAPATSPAAEGEVRKVDKEQAKLTLRHGPIASLDMPAMTMVFRVADPKMLESLKPGDKIRFAVENLNGALTVTAIDMAR